MPLKLDRNEAVAGEERRRDLDPTAAQDTLLAQPWEVDLEPGQPQEMQRGRLLSMYRAAVQYAMSGYSASRGCLAPMGLWFWFWRWGNSLARPGWRGNGAISIG
jgi:hypothetical protein